VWIVDDMVPPLLGAAISFPMVVWAVRGPDATRGMRRFRLGTSVRLIPREAGVGPQPLPWGNHKRVDGGLEDGAVRPSRHGSSGSAR
jgi:hypothetical protein